MITIVFTTGGFTVPLTVPDEQFCTQAQAESVAASLGGSSFVQSAVPPGAVLTATAGDTRGWWEIVPDEKLFPGRSSKTGATNPIMAFRLIAMMRAGSPGSWRQDPNGDPLWELTTAVTQDPVPSVNPTNTFPGFPGAVPAADQNAQMRADVARILAWAIRMGA